MPKNETTLSSDNFRTYAKKMIAKYEEKGMVIDALLWSRVIGEYESALQKAGVAEGQGT